MRENLKAVSSLLWMGAGALGGLCLLLAVFFLLVDAGGGVVTHGGANPVSYADGERYVDPDPNCGENLGCANVWNPGSDVGLDILFVAGVALGVSLFAFVVWRLADEDPL